MKWVKKPDLHKLGHYWYKREGQPDSEAIVVRVERNGYFTTFTQGVHNYKGRWFGDDSHEDLFSEQPLMCESI